MSKKNFAVMGATGHIGHVIVDELLKRGHSVRALGRDEKKMKELLDKGAELYFTDFEDVNILADAFKDTYAIFTMIPPTSQESNYPAFQDRVGEAICKAIKNSGANHVVNLSSLGADLENGTGPIKGLRKQEKRLDALKNLSFIVHLRAGYFMENLDGYVPALTNHGDITAVYRETTKLPFVATRDIGWKAADFMDSTAPQPHLIFEFVGPKMLTMPEVAKELGKAFDRPDLRYKKISFDEQKKKMLGAGMPAAVVDMMLEMYKTFDEGKVNPTQELKLSHHGITTLEEYAFMLHHKALTPVRR